MLTDKLHHLRKDHQLCFELREMREGGKGGGKGKGGPVQYNYSVAATELGETFGYYYISTHKTHNWNRIP